MIFVLADIFKTAVAFVVTVAWLMVIAYIAWRVYWLMRGVPDPAADDPVKTAAEALKKQRAKEHCASCGYDMRATPLRCPECGELVIDREKYLKALHSDWPADAIQPRVPIACEQMVILHSTEDAWEADLLHKQLLARGIANMLAQSELIGNARHKSRFQRVMVYEADLELARAYLRRAQGFPPEMLKELESVA